MRLLKSNLWPDQARSFLNPPKTAWLAPRSYHSLPVIIAYQLLFAGRFDAFNPKRALVVRVAKVVVNGNLFVFFNWFERNKINQPFINPFYVGSVWVIRMVVE